MKSSLLRLDNYSCIQRGAALFAPINLNLDQGKRLHIQAANGVGKTTLLRSLYGLAIETIGQVYWFDELITQGLAGKTIYINDRAGIVPRLTVIEALEKMLLLSGQVSPQKDLHAALEKVGLIDYQHLSDGLSKGQRKRLHLARLLLIQRPLWLLDEPFDGLDRQGESLLQTIMDEHLAQAGSILYTSHLPTHNQQSAQALKLSLQTASVA